MAKRSNDEADIEREKAYRRGYAYGIQAMMFGHCGQAFEG